MKNKSLFVQFLFFVLLIFVGCQKQPVSNNFLPKVTSVEMIQEIIDSNKIDETSFLLYEEFFNKSRIQKILEFEKVLSIDGEVRPSREVVGYTERYAKSFEQNRNALSKAEIKLLPKSVYFPRGEVDSFLNEVAHDRGISDRSKMGIRIYYGKYPNGQMTTILRATNNGYDIPYESSLPDNINFNLGDLCPPKCPKPEVATKYPKKSNGGGMQIIR